MALNLPSRAGLDEADQWLRSIAGTWMFRPVPHEGTSTDEVGETVLEGTFQLRPEPTDGVWSWRVKLTEDTGGHGSGKQPSVDSPGSAQSVGDSGTGLATSKLRAAETPRHRQMMAALKRELEARYGRAEKMPVRFHELRAQTVSSRLPQSTPWWSRVWGLFAVFYGKRLGAEV